MQEGLLLETIPPSRPVPLWKIYVILSSMILAFFAGSAIICGSDVQCRNHIPTVGNMLNSTMIAPFLITGFNAAIGIHFITVVGIYNVAMHKALYWALLQSFAAIMVYASTVATLFVLPFTGWSNNWANVFILVNILVWMIVAQIALAQGLRHRRMWPFVSMTILFFLCLIPYVVVRAVPDIPLPNKDVGLLVCEMIGGLSLGFFVLACILHVWNVQIKVYHPESKVD